VDIGLNLRDQKIGHIRLETDNEWTPGRSSLGRITRHAGGYFAGKCPSARRKSAIGATRTSFSFYGAEIWTSNTIDGILQTAVREIGRPWKHLKQQ